MLLGSDQFAVFLSVVATVAPPGLEPKVAKTDNSITQRFPRCGKDGMANVIVQLVNRTEADIETMLLRFGFGDGTLTFTLLEFPGVLLPAFQPTLTALQHMIETRDLPFAELLAATETTQGRVGIDKPA